MVFTFFRMYLGVIVELEVLGYGVNQFGISPSKTINGLLGVAHPIGVTLTFSDDFGKAIEDFQLDGVGVLELIHHHEPVVVANIIDDFLFFCDEREEETFHVVIGDDVLPLFVGYKIITPLFGKGEDGADEWLHDSKVGGGNGRLFQHCQQCREKAALFCCCSFTTWLFH